MRNLAIGIFENSVQAERVRNLLLNEQNTQKWNLDDAIVVEKTLNGRVKVRHLTRQTLGGALFGAFAGATIGLILLNPVFLLSGLIIGLVVGLVSGGSSHIGIDPQVAKKEAESMPPGSAAVCVLTRENAGTVLNELGRFGGNLMGTRLCAEAGCVHGHTAAPGTATAGVH